MFTQSNSELEKCTDKLANPVDLIETLINSEIHIDNVKIKNEFRKKGFSSNMISRKTHHNSNKHYIII